MGGVTWAEARAQSLAGVKASTSWGWGVREPSGGLDKASVEGSSRRRSWKCGWAGLFLVLSWGGRGPKGKTGTRVAQFPEIARWSTCPVAKD